MNDMDKTTKAVAAAWFAAMPWNSKSFLGFGLVDGMPSREALRALNILEAKGYIVREVFEDGSMKYFPIENMRRLLGEKLPNIKLTIAGE